ncbi:MAG: hypothetical protein RIT81_27765 [Deltaproteobacteria bacterium]
MRRLCLATVATLLWTSSASAAPAPVLVVFDLEDQRKKRERLDASQIRALTQYLRTRLAARGRFLVVPTSELRAALRAEKRESFKACYDESCQIEIGRELAAEKSVATKLSKLGSKCQLTASLFDLAKSTTETAATHRGSCDADALVEGLEQVARELRQDKQTSAGFARSVVDIGELDADETGALPQGASFAGLDVDRLERLQHAKRLEKKRGAEHVSARAAAWDAVAKGADDELAASARARADYWRKVGALKSRYEEDHAKLKKLSELDEDIVSADQKKAAELEFAETYAPYRGALASIGVELPWPQLSDGRFCPYGARLRRSRGTEQCIVNGKPDGPFRSKRRGGSVTGSYTDGKKSGVWVELFGSRKSECRYRDGKKNGACTKWAIANGKEDKKSECAYRDDRRHGACVSFGPNLRTEETYEDGKRHGVVKRIHESGTVISEKTYVHGRQEGPVVHREADGTVRLRGHYVNGRRHGEFVWFAKDGSELGRETFRNGTGMLLTFSNGKVRSKTRYERGQKRELTGLGPDGNRTTKQYWSPEGTPIGQWTQFDDEGRRCCELDYAALKKKSWCGEVALFDADGSRVEKFSKARDKACPGCTLYQFDAADMCRRKKEVAR